MKVKVRPEDFVVEEIADLPLRKSGLYGVYLLSKRGWNTVDALKRLSRETGVPFSDFSYGGKKDRHAVTTQHVTVRGRKPLREGTAASAAGNYSLSLLGFSDRPMGPDCVRGNRFGITLRSIDTGELDRARAAVPQVLRCGFPNYFDDQRFGSFDPRQGFIAEKIIREHFNGALKICMTHIHPEDKAPEKERKRFFSEHWGAWRLCRGKASTGLEETVFSYLAMEPRGFIPLLQRIPREEMSLFFSAYQSFLWNEVLRRVLAETAGDDLATYRGTAGEYLFYGELRGPSRDYLMNLSVPTAAALMTMPDDRVGRLYAALFGERGVKPSMFNVRSVRQAFFKSTERRAVVMPGDFAAEAGSDELYEGKGKLTLGFVLPRGSYGSMLVKRLFAGRGGS